MKHIWCQFVWIACSKNTSSFPKYIIQFQIFFFFCKKKNQTTRFAIVLVISCKFEWVCVSYHQRNKIGRWTLIYLQIWIVFNRYNRVVKKCECKLGTITKRKSFKSNSYASNKCPFFHNPLRYIEENDLSVLLCSNHTIDRVVCILQRKGDFLGGDFGTSNFLKIWPAPNRVFI